MANDPRQDNQASEKRQQELLSSLKEPLARITPASLPASLKEGDSALLGLGRVGCDFAVVVVVSGGMGWLADRWLGIQPWCLLGMVCFGFFVGVINVARALKALEKANEAQK